MPRARKDSKELRDKWLEVYRSNGCLEVTTCKQIGVELDRVLDWIRLFPDFESSKKEIERIDAEKIESNIKKQSEKNVIAGIFTLKKHINQDVRDRFSDDPPVQILAPQNLWFNKNKEPKQIVEGESEKVA